MQHIPIGLLSASAALVLAVPPPAAAAAANPAPDTAAQVTRFESPYVYTPEAQLPGGQMPWQKSYQADLDRAAAVGFGYSFFSLAQSAILSPTGGVDLSSMDPVVIAAHRDRILLVLNLQTCDFDVPEPPTYTGGGYRSNTGANNPVTCAPLDISATVPAWQALAARYAPGGALAREQGWTDGYGVNDFEVENEPNSLAWWGNYQNVAKDYALYLSKLSPAIHAVNPSAHILAAALSQDPQTPAPLTWLDDVLATTAASMASGSSDQYRAAVAAGDPIVGGGPFIDDYSYHEDFTDPAGNIFSRRPGELRSVVLAHSRQSTYPTSSTPRFWFTEGGPTITPGSSASTQLQWTHAEAQFVLETLGGGASHVAIDFSTNNMDAAATFEQEPDPLMARALTTFFPSGAGFTDTSAAMSSLARQKLLSYTWTNPANGKRSIAVWAADQASGSGATGTPFTVNLPVTTPQVTVVGADWSRRSVTASSGSVPVTLQSADPSGVVIVVEQGAAGPAAGVRAGSGSSSPAGLPDTAAAPSGWVAAAGATLVAAAAVAAPRALRPRAGRPRRRRGDGSSPRLQPALPR